jgi:hypothetical protein
MTGGGWLNAKELCDLPDIPPDLIPRHTPASGVAHYLCLLEWSLDRIKRKIPF